jgi:hypothetical protein
MPPAPKKPAAPVPTPAASNLRPVAYVEFSKAIKLPGYGIRVTELTAGEILAFPGAGDVEVPPLFRDSETQELLVGSRRYPLAGGLVASYELAKIARGRAAD